MNGYCKPKEAGIYTSERMMVSVYRAQKWQYKYGMRNGKYIVKVSRDNVSLYLSKDNFENEWEIIEKAEG
jgi:hypothetical protein